MSVAGKPLEKTGLYRSYKADFGNGEKTVNVYGFPLTPEEREKVENYARKFPFHRRGINLGFVAFNNGNGDVLNQYGRWKTVIEK